MTSPVFTFDSAARTHVGRVRTLNEDSFVDRPLVGLWAVADGMGGHQAGEVASKMITEALENVDSFSSGFAFLDDVRDSIMRVNRQLISYAAGLAPDAVVGSTVVVVLAWGGHYACLWAGDSRAYLLRNEKLQRLSRDHSMVQALLDSGSISANDAKAWRRGNVITRAVGVDADLTIDMTEGVIEDEDVFILCSDGLTGMVSDEELLNAAMNAGLEEAADRLLDLALQRGARDNVTFVLVRAGAPPEDTVERQASPHISWR